MNEIFIVRLMLGTIGTAGILCMVFSDSCWHTTGIQALLVVIQAVVWSFCIWIAALLRGKK